VPRVRRRPRGSGVTWYTIFRHNSGVHREPRLAPSRLRVEHSPQATGGSCCHGRSAVTRWTWGWPRRCAMPD